MSYEHFSDDKRTVTLDGHYSRAELETIVAQMEAVPVVDDFDCTLCGRRAWLQGAPDAAIKCNHVITISGALCWARVLP